MSYFDETRSSNVDESIDKCALIKQLTNLYHNFV